MLGIEEALPVADGGSLRENWALGRVSELELGLVALWQLAARTWPYLLKEETDLPPVSRRLKPWLPELRVCFQESQPSCTMRSELDQERPGFGSP